MTVTVPPISSSQWFSVRSDLRCRGRIMGGLSTSIPSLEKDHKGIQPWQHMPLHTPLYYCSQHIKLPPWHFNTEVAIIIGSERPNQTPTVLGPLLVYTQPLSYLVLPGASVIRFWLKLWLPTVNILAQITGLNLDCVCERGTFFLSIWNCLSTKQITIQ